MGLSIDTIIKKVDDLEYYSILGAKAMQVFDKTDYSNYTFYIVVSNVLEMTASMITALDFLE